MSTRMHATRRRLASGAAGVGLLTGVLVLPGLAGALTSAEATPPTTSGCHLGNGISHVVNLVFDNVHWGRDNPNVPSDLERIPALKSFLEDNGTVLSNTHTPMIAHTADDSLSIYTGLYGDRHGQPLSNSYKGYNPDGGTDPATSFAYWTSPFADTLASPTPGHDTAPSMSYSSTPSGTGTPGRIAPAPWVPFTRAGCNVGDFSTANMVGENANVDIPTLFGTGSPEYAQLAADTGDPFKDAEIADYIGEAVHCAQGSPVCANATATKYGQTTPSPTAVPDRLPDEPGGYDGYQALFGHKYIAPQLGAGQANLTSHGYPVTNATGNLVDENGKEIDGAFLTPAHPGFPGFSPTPSQTLAMVADMQESGIPVTYGYISDMHERKAGTSGCTTATATGSGKPIGPGDKCYDDNGKAYNAAFDTFFKRLAADGIDKSNTLFVISTEENDQFDGANVGRAMQPQPAGCDGVTVYCQYPSGSIGELQANIRALLAGTPSAATPFDLEPQGASIYVHGQPGLHDPALRQLERDTGAMTADNPYSGRQGEHIVKYQAGGVEERLLHMQTTDPLRMPSYSMFPVPDYFFATSGSPAVSINSGFAWDHGYYSPNIDVTWSAFVGPGVAHNGVDGPTPEQSNESHDPNSTNTVPEASTQGTWVEEVDLRPTMLHLLGLADDYPSDGQVVTQVLADPSPALTGAEDLGTAYRMINSAVGPLATTTLEADSRALASGSAGDDSQYDATETALTKLADRRDALAEKMKAELARAAGGQLLSHGNSQSLISQANNLMREAERIG